MLFYGAQFGYKPVFVVLIRWFEYEKESFLECDDVKYVIMKSLLNQKKMILRELQVKNW